MEFDRDIVQTYKKGNFDFIASSLFYRDGLGLDELAVRMEDTIEYLSILKGFLDMVLQEKSYDYVLIDCPPSNNLITRSAFLLSDYYIIPTILDRVSANDVAHYINTVNKTYQKCKYNNEDVYFFEEEINNYVDIARSTEIGQSSKARNDYNELSRIVLQRMQKM